MKKVILLASGLLCSSLVFASDPAAIDSLINLQGVVISANKVQVNRSSVPLTISVIDREQIEASSESALLPVLSHHVYVTELLIIRNKKVHVYDLVHVLHDFSQM
jgi:vitamin B12 transporter